MWTPWQRVEVFNCFLQAERHGLVDAGEGGQMVRLLDQEVRLGYWPHWELSWTEAIRRACQILGAISSARWRPANQVSLAPATVGSGATMLTGQGENFSMMPEPSSLPVA